MIFDGSADVVENPSRGTRHYIARSFKLKIIEPVNAVEKLKDRSTVIFPGACANPTRFYDAFIERVDGFRELTICSGLSLGDYRFLNKGLGVNYRYVTWQAGIGLRRLFKDNDRRKISFVPLRLADLSRIVNRNGPIKPDTLVLQTSVPQDDGTVNLGISVGPNLHFLKQARQIIAEFNVNMPVTNGNTKVSLADIDYAIESDHPLATYETGMCDERESKIVDNVLSLVPEKAFVQLGIGSIPDKVLSGLGALKNINLFSGMLSSGLVDYLNVADEVGQVVAGELAGGKTLYEICHLNPLIKMESIDKTHDVRKLAQLDNFISINSTVEIDLHGQCNGETLGAVQISGVGGSLDYIEAAAMSSGGKSILALPSTTKDDAYSKIVGSFAAGSIVTTPRYCVDYVVTEYGIAQLAGKSLWERSESLIEIAHPKFREELVRNFNRLV